MTNKNKKNIELKIEELKKKLKQKETKFVKGKLRTTNISKHLREFYLSEIEKLKLDKSITNKNDIKENSRPKTTITKFRPSKSSIKPIYTPMGNKR